MSVGFRFTDEDDDRKGPARTVPVTQSPSSAFLPGGVPRLAPEESAPAAHPVSTGFRFTDEAPSTLGERAKAVGQGAAGGFVDALPLAGAGVGAVLGGVPGAAAGLGGGVTARVALNHLIDIPSPEEMPAELRPYGYGGEAAGASLATFGMLPLAAAKGVTTGVRFFDRIIQTFQRNPKAVMAADAAATASGAVAEGVTEAMRPGETGKRIAAGVAGSVLAPTTVLPMAADAVKGAFSRVTASYSKAGREFRARKEFERILADDNLTPADIIKELDAALAQMPADARPTVAQLTGNRTLIDLEADLRRRNAVYGREVREQAEQTLEILRKSADVLTLDGSPEALREAARLRSDYFEALVGSYLSDAERQVKEIAAEIGPLTPEAMSTLSRRTGEILDTALAKARAEERRLYEAVPDEAMAVSHVLSRYEAIRADTLQEVPMPRIASRFATRMTQAMEGRSEGTGLFDATGNEIRRQIAGTDKPTSVKELRQFRTEMLNEARKAAATGDRNQARIYGELAEAALEDMGAAAVDGSPLAIAREYSRSLNDVFTRTFAGDAAAVGSDGARRLPPELLLRRASATGKELAALRVKELRQAVEFGDPAAGEELMAMQEQFLRTAASELMDPSTGLPSRARLITFRRNHAETLEMFPELKGQLQTLDQVNEMFRGAQVAGKAARAEASRSALAVVMRQENPVQAVDQILRGPNPQAQFAELALVARQQGGDEAVDGLARAVTEHAWLRAGGDENFSFARYHRILFEPRRAGAPSAVDLMRRHGVMSEAQINRMETLIRRAELVEKAISSGDRIDTMVEQADAITDLALRIGGATLGGRAAQAVGSPNQLIAHAAGSSFTRQMFDKVPANRTMDVIMDVSKDPEKFRLLMRKNPTPAERLKIGMTMYAYLWSQGLIRGPEDALDAMLDE